MMLTYKQIQARDAAFEDEKIIADWVICAVMVTCIIAVAFVEGM